ncbi:hypothetical protein ACTXT7_003239 [Hymenolepis weldensis]
MAFISIDGRYRATASIPQAAYVALPGPHQPPPPVVSWNSNFTTEAHHQVALARLFDPQPPPNRSGAKTNVVYAVLSNSTARFVHPAVSKLQVQLMVPDFIGI